MGSADECVAPAPGDFLNFQRTSLLSRNEFENGTFTIVLHATFSFTYVSVIYGAYFPFKVASGVGMKKVNVSKHYCPARP